MNNRFNKRKRLNLDNNRYITTIVTIPIIACPIPLTLRGLTDNVMRNTMAARSGGVN
jgi:hypothetical protein